MSIFENITSGKIKKPIFCALYSGPGVGKTDFGASFPKPLFFDFEESTHNIDVKRIDNLRSFDAIMEGLEEIYHEDKLDFQSIVFDTIDELERLMHVHIADEAGKETIMHIGFQRGFEYAVNLWAKFLGYCRMIRDKHGIHFCFLCHEIDRTKNEVGENVAFSRHQMNLHKKATAFVFGQVEMVLFAKKEVAFTKDQDGNSHAKDLDKRTLCTSLSAYYDAKNRIGLPATLPMPVRNGFDVLYNAYNKAFDQKPAEVYAECINAMKDVKDKPLKDSMKKYCDENKNQIEKLRSALIRINENIGDSK